jgi:hypothetical protein
MKGYILIDLEITDPEGFQEYLELAGPTVKQYGGKVLVGGATSETLEGNRHPPCSRLESLKVWNRLCAGTTQRSMHPPKPCGLR